MAQNGEDVHAYSAADASVSLVMGNLSFPLFVFVAILVQSRYGAVVTIVPAESSLPTPPTNQNHQCASDLIKNSKTTCTGAPARLYSQSPGRNACMCMIYVVLESNADLNNNKKKPTDECTG